MVMKMESVDVTQMFVWLMSIVWQWTMISLHLTTMMLEHFCGSCHKHPNDNWKWCMALLTNEAVHLHDNNTSDRLNKAWKTMCAMPSDTVACIVRTSKAGHLRVWHPMMRSYRLAVHLSFRLDPEPSGAFHPGIPPVIQCYPSLSSLASLELQQGRVGSRTRDVAHALRFLLWVSMPPRKNQCNINKTIIMLVVVWGKTLVPGTTAGLSYQTPSAAA